MSVGGSWSEWKGHLPVEKELLVAVAAVVAAAAAVGVVGKEGSGLVKHPVMSPDVLNFFPEKHLGICHTASESVTETVVAVNSPKPAAVVAAAAEFAAAEFGAVAVFAVVAVEFVVFGVVVDAECVAAAVL